MKLKDVNSCEVQILQKLVKLKVHNTNCKHAMFFLDYPIKEVMI